MKIFTTDISLGREELIKFWKSPPPLDPDLGMFLYILQHIESFSTIWFKSLDLDLRIFLKVLHYCHVDHFSTIWFKCLEKSGRICINIFVSLEKEVIIRF